jgi:hypothetical protein
LKDENNSYRGYDKQQFPNLETYKDIPRTKLSGKKKSQVDVHPRKNYLSPKITKTKKERKKKSTEMENILTSLSVEQQEAIANSVRTSLAKLI